MIPVDQSIVTAGEGDCMRAVVASLLELPLDAVPHFMRFEGDRWWNVYFNFLWAFDWEVDAYCTPDKHHLDTSESIGGYFDASVPSKTFPGKSHAVIIDATGMVVHDPNPNKRWLGVNVLESGELKGWYSMKRSVNFKNSHSSEGDTQ